MAVVVSDTTPLHYLILIGQERILQHLYGRVLVPPGVLTELSDGSAPVEISSWAASPPTWLVIKAPNSIPKTFEKMSLGEQQALALAKETSADFVLLDDLKARRVAEREGLAIKGTLGVVREAAMAKLLDFPETVHALQKTSMHIDPDLVKTVLREYKQSMNGISN
jgi:predicted nucleic acid-binding protein